MDGSTLSLCPIIESTAAPEKFPPEKNVFISTSGPERAVTGGCARGSARASCKEIAQAYEDWIRVAGQKRPQLAIDKILQITYLERLTVYLD